MRRWALSRVRSPFPSTATSPVPTRPPTTRSAWAGSACTSGRSRARWHEHHGRDGGEENADSAVVEDGVADVGAYIMGRKMFDGGEGPLDESWTRLVGRGPAVPRAGLRAHAPRARPAPDAGRHHVPLRDGRDRVGARAGPRGGGRRPRDGRRRRQRRQPVPRRRPARRAPAPHRPVVLGGGSRLLAGVGDRRSSRWRSSRRRR